MPNNEKPDDTPQSEFIRDPEFTSLYANNIRFESSVWDLKLIFGELDQSNTPSTVVQHTSVSMPWLQAKLMAYFLEMNIAIYEADNGSIKVPARVTPPRFSPHNPEIAGNELALAVVEYLEYVHRRYFGDPKSANGLDQETGT